MLGIGGRFWGPLKVHLRLETRLGGARNRRYRHQDAVVPSPQRQVRSKSPKSKRSRRLRRRQTETCDFFPSAEPQPPSPRPCHASRPGSDALAASRARCRRRLGIAKIWGPKGAPGSRGSCRPDDVASTSHPVRPRVSLLKELCTSPNCCAGCYAGILWSWQVTDGHPLSPVES